MLKQYQGPVTWEDLTETNIRPRNLLQFMADTGVIMTKQIIMNYQKPRAAEYECRADI